MNNAQAIQNPCREGHVVREITPDDDGPMKAFDPGSIVVGGAVMVAFALAA